MTKEQAKTQQLIRKVTDEVRDMLLAKNTAYGNSALDPVRIFSKADPIEQINVRMDDKLSRLARGHAAGEDVELDLIGYLILKRVALRMQKKSCAPAAVKVRHLPQRGQAVKSLAS